MTHRLCLFDKAEDAAAAVNRSKISDFVQILNLSHRGADLKRARRDGVEPTYLCDDGRWRRYDLIVDLPHSTAPTAIAAVLAKS